MKATVLAVLFVCFSMMPSRGAAQEVFANDRLWDLGIAGSRVYWHESCGDDFSGDRSFLRVKDAGAPPGDAGSVLFRTAGCTGDRIASNVAADTTHFYWLSGDGRVLRLAQSATEGTAPETIAATGSRFAGFPPPSLIAVDDTSVYWNAGEALWRSDKTAGATPQRMLTGLRLVRDLRAAGGGALYVLDGEELAAITRSAGGVARRAVASGVFAFAVSAGEVLWAERAGDGFSLRSAPHSGGPAAVLHTDGTAGARVTAMAADAANVFWFARVASSPGRIWRMPAGSRTPASITSETVIAPRLASDGQHVYWHDSNEAIFRARAGSPAVEAAGGDIWIDGMEVTQAIQTTANDVPLIAGKLTFVRVYARSREDVNGPWTDVTATLSVDGGRTYTGGRPQRLSPAGSDRRTLDGSFLFALDADDTRGGMRTLRASIQPAAFRPESDPANNRSEVTVTFAPSAVFGVRGFAYQNMNNGADCSSLSPFGTVQSFGETKRQFVENVYPVAAFGMTLLPGSGRAYDNSGCTAGMNPALQAAMNEAVGLMDRLHPEGGKRALVLAPETAAAGWCCRGDSGNSVAWVAEDEGFDPGSNAAHELGHSLLGNAHSDDPATGFPHAGGGAGPQVGLRKHPSVRTMPGQNADGTIAFFDILANPSPMWISPNTYCRLTEVISGGSTVCGSSTIRASIPPGIRLASLDVARFLMDEQKEGRYIYVAGTVAPDGSVELEPFEVRALQVTPYRPQGKTWRVVLEDGSGNAVEEVGFEQPAGTYRGGKGPELPYRFGVYLPWRPDVRRITFSRDGKVLAERLVTPNAPQVALVAPAGGSTLKGVAEVAWKAADADGDPVWASVWYSGDGGQTWIPVAVNVAGGRAEIDFERLPGSDQALLRVLASDGANTTEAQIDAPVIVPRKAPEVAVSGGELNRDLGHLLRASATDAEDGLLTGTKALIWTDDAGKPIGYGPWVVVGPDVATKTVTVIATDSDGQSAKATTALSQ